MLKQATNLTIEAVDEANEEERMMGFNAMVVGQGLGPFEFDFVAIKNILSTTDEEVLEIVRDCDDDAWNLIVKTAAAGIPVLLNHTPLASEVIIRMATPVVPKI